MPGIFRVVLGTCMQCNGIYEHCKLSSIHQCMSSGPPAGSLNLEPCLEAFLAPQPRAPGRSPHYEHSHPFSSQKTDPPCQGSSSRHKVVVCLWCWHSRVGEWLHLAFSSIALHCFDAQSCLLASLRAERNPRSQRQIERRRRRRRLLPKQMPTRCVAAKPVDTATYFAARTPVRGDQVVEVANKSYVLGAIPFCRPSLCTALPHPSLYSTQFHKIIFTPSECAPTRAKFAPFQACAIYCIRSSSKMRRCAAGSPCSQSSCQSTPSCSCMHVALRSGPRENFAATVRIV